WADRCSRSDDVADGDRQSVPTSVPGQPSGRGQQVPSWFGRLQLVHGSVQAVLQQAPLAQNPEAHSALAMHVAPLRTWQKPPVSQYVPMQSASVMHWAKQATV